MAYLLHSSETPHVVLCGIHPRRSLYTGSQLAATGKTLNGSNSGVDPTRRLMERSDSAIGAGHQLLEASLTFLGFPYLQNRSKTTRTNLHVDQVF
jgi:hypothetical protein